jgi:hypothetical protein
MNGNQTPWSLGEDLLAAKRGKKIALFGHSIRKRKIRGKSAEIPREVEVIEPTQHGNPRETQGIPRKGPFSSRNSSSGNSR